MVELQLQAICADAIPEVVAVLYIISTHITDVCVQWYSCGFGLRALGQLVVAFWPYSSSLCYCKIQKNWFDSIFVCELCQSSQEKQKCLYLAIWLSHSVMWVSTWSDRNVACICGICISKLRMRCFINTFCRDVCLCEAELEFRESSFKLLGSTHNIIGWTTTANIEALQMVEICKICEFKDP